MNKYTVVVIDSFGVGYMDDCKDVRPQDIGANTCRAVLTGKPKLPNLEKLGLMNAAGFELENMKYSDTACFGKISLKHFYADTFQGHQELMLTEPKKPNIQPINDIIYELKDEIEAKGYKVELVGDKLKLLLVDGCMFVGDNLEADLGTVYNIETTFQETTFEKLLEFAKFFRTLVKTDRVICFGGTSNSMQDMYDAIEIKFDKYIGVNAPKSKVYDEGYLVRHLGYGVDDTLQAPHILDMHGIKTILLGKVADIVANPSKESYNIVDTTEVMEKLEEVIKDNDNCYICANVQETDLAGHAMDKEKYYEKLAIVDKHLGIIMDMLDDTDVLVVTADHGNDPTIGHSKHTREYVPMLVFNKKLGPKNLGHLDSLQWISKFCLEFFKIPYNN